MNKYYYVCVCIYIYIKKEKNIIMFIYRVCNICLLMFLENIFDIIIFVELLMYLKK